VSFDFKYDGGGIGKGGTGTLAVDGKKVAEGRIERTAGIRFSADETFDIGMDLGTPESKTTLLRCRSSSRARFRKSRLT
jgi:hypothetical protein